MSTTEACGIVNFILTDTLWIVKLHIFNLYIVYIGIKIFFFTPLFLKFSHIWKKLSPAVPIFQNKIYPTQGGYITKQNLLFYDASNKTLITPGELNNYLKRICKKYNISNNVDFHMLRHTHASLLLREGVDLKTISERLGHSTIRQTMDIYTRFKRTRRKGWSYIRWIIIMHQTENKKSAILIISGLQIIIWSGCSICHHLYAFLHFSCPLNCRIIATNSFLCFSWLSLHFLGVAFLLHYTFCGMHSNRIFL